ncbi:MAG: hypothetical protein H6741_15405 [Alphaproteobacteria bacterium]|nr:hypothetical protein [Alphaproteobacteria bacterium]MCB9794101.1 hypothetical protein [Alphaproteobacteria bacterium]
MAPQLPAPRPLTRTLERLRAGCALRKLLRPGEAEALLGGRAQVCGLVTFAEELSALGPQETLDALQPHWAAEAEHHPLWMLDLPLGPLALSRAARIPVDRRPMDPLEAWLPRLRRDDGDPVGVYRGDGRCATLAHPPELILAAPTPLPAGAKLWLREAEDRLVATLGPRGWVLADGLPAELRERLNPLLRPPEAAPLPLQDEDDSNALRFGPALSASLRRQALACAAPGVPWRFVEERFLRFNWIVVHQDRGGHVLQHQGGAFLEVRLDDAGRVRRARCVEGDEATQLDLTLGGWHRRGRPLFEAPEAAELSFSERLPEGRLTLNIEPDGFASVTAQSGEARRAWSGQVEPALHAHLLEQVRAAGFLRGAGCEGEDCAVVELQADGERLAARLPPVLDEDHPFAELREALVEVRERVTRGRWRRPAEAERVARRG